MTNNQNKKKKNGISIAELIAVLAFALFAVLSYFGLALRHGMAMGICMAAGCCIFLLLISLFLKKCKTVENDFKNWRIFEVLALLVFVVAGYFFNRPVVKAISVVKDKPALIETGTKDIDALLSLFDTYEQTEGDNIATVRASLNSCVGATMDSKATKLLHKTKRSDSVSEYCYKLTTKYVGTGGEGTLKYSDFKTNTVKRLNEDKATLENWKLLRLPEIASSINDEREKIIDCLTEISSQVQPETGNPYKYVFYRDVNTYQFRLDEEGTRDLMTDYHSKSPALHFGDRIRNSTSGVGELCAWCICLLMLLPYLAAYRSSTVGIRRKKRFGSKTRNSDNEDDGISLYD